MNDSRHGHCIVRKTRHRSCRASVLWCFVVLMVALGFGLGACSSGPDTEAQEPRSVDEDQESMELIDSDLIPVGDSPTRGADDAWVTVVVFADFECPFCGRLAATLDEVKDAYDDGVVRVVFKHYPLEDHGGARPAARAAEAAGKQGKFWEMHDLLFDNLSEVRGDDSEAIILQLATRLDVDEQQFERDFHSSEVAERIERDRQLGDELRIDGAPAVFVNGGYISGARSADVYHSAIQNVFEILRRGVADGEMERRDVYQSSVETLYSHTGPDDAPDEPAATPVVDLPIDDGNPDTADIDEATVHIGVFISLGEDTSLQLQRMLEEVTESDEQVRITYFHLASQLDDAARLAHRALEGTTSQHEVRRLLTWLSDEDNDWRSDPSLLRDFLAGEEISVADESDFDDALQADIEAAQTHEVFGTPTYFINGIRFIGAPSQSEEIADVVEEQVALASRIGQIQGVSGQRLYEEMVQGNRQRELEMP